MVPPVKEKFISSHRWLGEKKGFYFGTGNAGTGYYVDTTSSTSKGVYVTTKKPKAKKTVTIAEDQNEMKLLLEELEKKADGSLILDLSSKGIHAAAKSLESMYRKNVMKRAEFPDHPYNYMDSEIALYEQLNALQALATDTTIYRYVLDSDIMSTLIQLLAHENVDICSSVISLLLEWIDPSLVENDPKVLQLLKSFAITTMEAWTLIATNLVKFQSQDDENSKDRNLNGVENTLSLMENMLEVDALLAPEGIMSKNVTIQNIMASESRIVSWLFINSENTDKLSNKNDSLKARCLEILALFSQSTDLYDALPDWSNLSTLVSTRQHDEHISKKRKDTAINGIEILLQSIAVNRKSDPKNSVELENLENSCIALCSCISFSTANLSAFLDGDGVELVIRCLKEKTHAGCSGLKLLEFFGDDDIYKVAAERLITAGSLKYLFPILGSTRYPKPAPIHKISIKAKRKWLYKLQVQTIRILYALTFQLDNNSPEEAVPRFISKFVDGDLKYCDRLVELLLEYDEQARKAEYNFYRSEIEENIDQEDQVTLAAFEAKLSGGGYISRYLAAITAYICANSKRCHERVLENLKMHKSGMGLIKDTLKEFSSSLINDGRQKQHIEKISNLI